MTDRPNRINATLSNIELEKLTWLIGHLDEQGMALTTSDVIRYAINRTFAQLHAEQVAKQEAQMKKDLDLLNQMNARPTI